MATIRILIAGDHDGFRRSLSAFLSAQPGVEIIGEARDGVEAVDKAAALRPTLVLMDLDMPSRDGFEATRQIKSLVPDVKVVLLSICGEEVYRRMAWKYSADGFIDKSAMKRALVMLIANEQARLMHSPMRESATWRG